MRGVRARGAELTLARFISAALLVGVVGHAAADPTSDAVPGAALRALVPPTLGGARLARSLDYPWSAVAAYEVGGGRYYNLDLQNTFHRGMGGDDSGEKAQLAACKQKATVAGFPACVRVEPGTAFVRWYLPDRLVVSLAAADEATVRKLALELPLAKLAKLSRTK